VTDVGTNQIMTISSILEDRSREFLIISTNTGLVAGRQYRLAMTFISILNDELRGFYRSSYTEKDAVKYMAVSQMQPTDARRAFPCFDEYVYILMN
jgi:aminopeptidase N